MLAIVVAAIGHNLFDCSSHMPHIQVCRLGPSIRGIVFTCYMFMYIELILLPSIMSCSV